jgi:hypothetical protein|tara:strand:- start:15796 stop:16014 length:219 start_codon:yes stop_codon:yes gene_type:complete
LHGAAIGYDLTPFPGVRGKRLPQTAVIVLFYWWVSIEDVPGLGASFSRLPARVPALVCVDIPKGKPWLLVIV